MINHMRRAVRIARARYRVLYTRGRKKNKMKGPVKIETVERSNRTPFKKEIAKSDIDTFE